MREVTFFSIAKYAGISSLVLVLAACGNSTAPPATTALGSSALSGTYVFSVTGTDANDGDYSVLGSFTADGKGGITGGTADYNLGSGVDTDVALSGNYTVGSGTAQVTLTDGGVVKDTFSTTLVSTGTSTIASFDGTGSGTIYPQATAGYTAPGTYSFSLAGEGDGVISGSGQFVAAAGGGISSGNLTFTDAQSSISYPTVTGFLGPLSASGRGFANIEGNNLAYYVIGPNQIQMMGIDARFLLTIPAQKM